jgi:hypothetical protein
MTFKDVVAYDVTNVLTSTDDWGEAATYTDSTISPATVSLNVVWSDEGWADEDGGTFADRATIFVDYEAMTSGGSPVTPIRLGTVTRTNDSSIWAVREVQASDSSYTLYVQKATRPAPDGA